MNISALLQMHPSMPFQLKYFFDGWKPQSNNAIVPDYGDFSPSNLIQQLSHISILEMDQAGGVFLRLSGSAVDSLHGRTLTRTQFSDHYKSVEEAEAVNEIFAQAMIQNCGLIRLCGRQLNDRLYADPLITVCMPIAHPQSLGGNLLLCLSLFDKNLERPMLGNSMALNDKTAISDSWQHLTYIEISDYFNESLMAPSVRDFLCARDSQPNTVPYNILKDHLEDYGTEKPRSIGKLEFDTPDKFS